MLYGRGSTVRCHFQEQIPERTKLMKCFHLQTSRSDLSYLFKVERGRPHVIRLHVTLDPDACSQDGWRISMSVSLGSFHWRNAGPNQTPFGEVLQNCLAPAGLFRLGGQSVSVGTHSDRTMVLCVRRSNSMVVQMNKPLEESCNFKTAFWKTSSNFTYIVILNFLWNLAIWGGRKI